MKACVLDHYAKQGARHKAKVVIQVKDGRAP